MTEIIVGLVGPCTSGKSTIRNLLEEKGYRVKHIAQEHSFAPKMWKLIADPDILVFLDVSYPVTLQRRKWNWKLADYEEQLRRLSHARANADLVIDTDRLAPDQIVEQIALYIRGD